jgi:hypothetical protein
MGKNKVLPPNEASCFGRESLYEAFWRTLVCDIDADGKCPVDLNQAFQLSHEAIMRNQELKTQFQYFSSLVSNFTPSQNFHN